MRVFVTGAGGFVGSAVVPELIGAGHQVIALARTDASAATAAAMGASVHRGSLEDHVSLGAGADAADAVVHLAFNHDFSNFAQNAALDRAAIEAIGERLQGSQKPLLVTSGLALLAPGRVVTEDDGHARVSERFPRASEAAADAVIGRGVRAAVVRLAPSVHGEGDRGFVPMLIAVAREKGLSGYIGDGSNRWPGVHRRDAAAVYRLALERGGAGPFHACDEEGVPFKAIAEVIGRRLGVPVASIAPDEAADHFGWFAMFAGMDMPAASAKTRETLGWRPTQPGLLADIDQPSYFGG